MSIKTWIAPLVVSACVCGGSISAQELPPGSPYDALSSWSFNDTNSWKSDLGYKPLSFTNICMSELGDGPAVVVDSPSPAWLRYSVIDMGQTNLVVGNTGSLLFWFAPSWSGTNAGGGGPGVWGRLIEVGSYTTNASLGWWSLYTDPEGCNLFFSAQTNGATAVYLSAPISWETNRWHFVALTYSRTNASLYLDGTLATNASGVTLWPADTVSTNGFCLGSSADGANQAHGMFDSLKTYGYVLTARSISNYFNGTDIDYWGNPMNTANLAKVPYDPPVPAPGFRAIMGSGSVRQIGIAAGCATNASVWMTNVTAKLTNNGTMNLTFKVGGGSPGVAYDVFGADGLIGNSISNAEWVWLGQAYACSTNVVTNLPAGSALFALGTDRDSDGDGLTDAFELLVSKTDPNNPDTYGTGVLDWWQFIHFGTNVMDPFADADGDGWTNLKEYQNGTDPLSFDTPPPPQNVVAKVDGTGTNITVTWQSGGGPVTNYVVQLGAYYDSSGVTYSAVTSVGPSTFTCNFSLAHPAFGNTYPVPGVRVLGRLSNGSSPTSAPVGLSTFDASLTGQFSAVRGPGGHFYMIASVPPSVTSLYFFTGSEAGHYVSITNLTDGVMMLPDNSTYVCVQPVTANGTFGAPTGFTWQKADEALFPLVLSFPDASAHMKENLKYMLRSAGRSQPFAYNSGIATELYSYGLPIDAPELHYLRAASPTNYEYYGFHTYSPNLGYSFIEELRPVRENFILSNYAYNSDTVRDFAFNMVPCELDTAVRNLRSVFNWAVYSGSGTETNPPIALVNSNGQWFYFSPKNPAQDTCGLALDVGIVMSASGKYYLNSGVRNRYGLVFKSAYVDYRLIQAGVENNATANERDCYMETEIPGFQINSYYFASQTPYFNYNGDYGTPVAALPGSPDFSVTNVSTLLITSIGQPITVSGWAKMSITNGYSDKFAYLEQYFEKARTMSNGTATAKSAGVISPYGEFFPTEPGPAAVITFPDIDTGSRGTGVVNVIKLQLDVNHDGKMDLSLGGPDMATADRPLVFWVNNDCDWNSAGYDSVGEDREVSRARPADYTSARMTSERDLEDWARLWICGVPALATNQGYSVTLSMSAQSGSPAINLVDEAETNGGTLYLTDTNAASAQLFSGGWYRLKYPTISPTTPLTLPANLFTNAGNKYFLFEGAGIGAGQLTMTILQGSNVLAQTSTWLDLHDVKDFYEQAYATNVTSGKPPSSLVSDFGVIETASATPDQTKQVIIFVHGINNTVTDYESTTRTIFKRLHWAGYHGKFASFRWPCAYLPPSTVNPFQFNKGEFYAWKSATAFKNYLSYLRNRPDLAGYTLNIYAHSQGNVVATEAVMQGATFDNYILTQGAIPAHCYDTNAPFLQKLLDAEANNPNALQTPFYPVDGGYHGYFYGIQGNLVNFYNTNDFALSKGVTVVLGIPIQTNWEEDQRTQKPEAFIGGPSYLYDPATHITTGYWTFGGSYTVTDLQEIKALVARSRSAAVGAQGGLHGVIRSGVDLKASFQFGETREEHSAQFARTIHTAIGYWDEVVRTFSPPTP